MALDTRRKRQAALLGSVGPVPDGSLSAIDRAAAIGQYRPHVSGPYCAATKQSYIPGAILSHAYLPGKVASGVYLPGAVAAQGDC